MQSIRMKTALYTTLGMITFLAGVSGLQVAHAQQNRGGVPQPICKITPVKAIKIAEGKVSGRPLQANFELDEGKWVYGVIIVKGKTISEVEIDTISGKVTDEETVMPSGEANELRDELTKAIGSTVRTNTGTKESGE